MTTKTDATEFQRAALSFRKSHNTIWAGGRGSGKSHGAMLAVLSHCNELGAHARVLVTRESHAGLQEVQAELYTLCLAAFNLCDRNKSEGTLTLPNGAVIFFSNISDEVSYSKHQGRTYTMLLAEECGNYPPQGFALWQRLRSNLRTPPGIRPEIALSCNPHGRNHSVLFKNYISKAPPWHPFTDDFGADWIWVDSSYRDNPHIDREEYPRQILASANGDQALADAWMDGTWSVLGGVMFDPFDPAVHLITELPNAKMGRSMLGADWGISAPATCLLMAIYPQAQGYPPGSIFVVDEVDTASPTDLSHGMGYPPQVFREMIMEMLARNGKRYCEGVIDDAKGLSGETVVELMNEESHMFAKPEKKDRVGQWALIRQLLNGAITGDGPGIYFHAERCPHIIETLPEAPRGLLRAEDVDPRWDRDHWLDALAYGCRALYQTYRVNSNNEAGHAGMYY